MKRKNTLLKSNLSFLFILIALQQCLGIKMNQFIGISLPLDIEIIQADTCENIDTILVDPILCYGESLVINGVIYDVYNSVGIELAEGEDGCDMMYIIDLDFYPLITTYLTDTLCENAPEIPIEGTFILQDVNGCDSIIIFNVVLLSPNDPECMESSMDEEDSGGILKCYPNPVKDNLIIEASENCEGVYSIMTIGGVSMLSGRLVSNSYNQINMESLLGGYYYIVVKMGRRMSYGKVLKVEWE